MPVGHLEVLYKYFLLHQISVLVLAHCKRLYNYVNELISQLISTALQFEDLQKYASTLATGLVVANQNMTEIVPVYIDMNDEMIVFHYSLKYAEAAGLV